MTKTILLAIILAGVTLAGLIWLSPSPAVVLALAAASLGGGWLFATWYFADQTPLFAPGTAPGRVTFKRVLEGVLRDVRDLLKLDVLARWALRNIVSLAVLANGIFAFADPTLRTALLSATWNGLPLGAIGIMVVAWLAQTRTAAAR